MAIFRAPLTRRPSIQSRYANLVSHTYSISSALQSASSQFLASQVAELKDFLHREARDANAFEDSQASLFHSLPTHREATDLPSVRFTDHESRLPLLAVHPCQPVADAQLNWLGTLLRTVPEVEISKEEDDRVAAYDKAYTDADVDKQIADHDARSLGALRTWYHLLYAPDQDGDTYDFHMRFSAAEGG